MTMVETKAPTIEVLLVEDSPGDIRLMHEAFRTANNRVRLNVATDGVEAISFLRQKGSYNKCPRPNLILMDLNLPKMSGLEVLAQIKEDPALKTIPTVILTISDPETDIAKGYRMQANCYLRKPVQLDAFEELVKSINDFWLVKARLPPQVQVA
jgi:CheY-like chemotaxis protein